MSAYVSLAMRYGALSPIRLVLDTPRFVYETKDKALFDILSFESYESRINSGNLDQWARKWKVKAGTQLVSSQGTRTSVLSVSDMKLIDQYFLTHKNMIAMNIPQAYEFLLGLKDDEIDHQGYVTCNVALSHLGTKSDGMHVI